MATVSIERIRHVDRTLRRFLGPVLLLLAGVLGAPAVGMAASALLGGNWDEFVVGLFLLALVATVGWLGCLFCADRRLPAWFVPGLYAATCTLAALGLISMRLWIEGAAFIVLTTPWIPTVWAAARLRRPTRFDGAPGAKKAKSTSFDDFA